MTERVENRSEVVCSTVTVRVLTGVGLSGSKAEGPGSVNVYSESSAVSRQFKDCYPRSARSRDGRHPGHREGDR